MIDQTTLQNGRGRPGIEELLRRYFRAEMPQPWPRFQAPPPRRARPSSWWQRSRLRLGLAASVALLLSGYLTLAGLFPRSSARTDLPEVVSPIGHREGVGKHFTPVIPNGVEHVKTPRGRDARVLEEIVPGPRPGRIYNIEAEPAASKGQR